MQDYKIRTNGQQESIAVQEKAFSLGCKWYSSGSREIRDNWTQLGLYYNRNGRMLRETNESRFFRLPQQEISYQDFLRLGEIDVNNCKIRLPKSDYRTLINLNNKLLSLGIKGYALVNQYVPINNPVRDLRGSVLTNTDYNDQNHPGFMFIRNGQTCMIGLESYFNQLSEKEVTIDQIMQLQSTINNTTTQIMSEVTLKCIKQPQRARNITVDREYTGILIDSEDTQVDSWEEAEFFQCVNNNGLEAKYKLALFTTITPPPPPKITQQQFLDGLNILADRVSITFHGDILRVLDFGYNILSDDGTTCSCGIHSSNGLDGLWDRLEDDGIQNTGIIDNYDADDLIDEMFKAIVLARVHNVNAGLVLFSTTEDSSLVCELMDWLVDAQGGYGTDVHLNPNSGNQIKAWLIPKL